MGHHTTERLIETGIIRRETTLNDWKLDYDQMRVVTSPSASRYFAVGVTKFSLSISDD